jgi:hypothetical protein
MRICLYIAPTVEAFKVRIWRLGGKELFKDGGEFFNIADLTFPDDEDFPAHIL